MPRKRLSVTQTYSEYAGFDQIQQQRAMEAGCRTVAELVEWIKRQTYEEYAGFASRQMRQRAMEAGCRTAAEMSEWFDKNYGDRSQREKNLIRSPSPYRRHDES